MSEIDNQDLNSKAVPFFARYLEEQIPEELSEEEMAALSGGVLAPGSVTTLRYPSDQEGSGGGTGAFPAIKMPAFLDIPYVYPHPWRGFRHK